MPELLIELLSEEIPARMQPRAADDLGRLMTEGLAAEGLTHGPVRAFVTPRRLALVVEGLAPRSPDRVEERRGPRTDAPEAAIAGFLRATGVAREALEVRPDRRGEVFYAVLRRPGRPAAEIVAEVLERVIRGFPWPKAMRWGEGSLRWVRPLRRILCLIADGGAAQVVPLTIDGIAAGDLTEGHRFMAPEPIRVTGPADYRERLAAAHVLLDPAERAARIEAGTRAAAAARGLVPVEDRALLTEVAGLVEWPVVLAGTIPPDFLELPPEVLRTSMREHQKFFSLMNPSTGRIEGFVTIANRETADGGAAILAGNARVLAARLTDARFFWENDLRTVREKGLEGMARALDGVTFHARLGSQGDRIRRIEALARRIAPQVGAPTDLAAEAARVAKADLASQMVYEFPELQGIMGRYYARAAGLPEAVAEACAEHYRPLGAEDAPPTAPVSVAVALADKIDMLTGFWSIGEKPTGSGDPFALRRAALGVIRILLEGGHRLALAPLFGQVARDLLAFFHDRLKVHLRGQGIRHDVIDACLASPGNDDLVLLVARVRALQDFLSTEDGANLLAGWRRAASIVAAEERKDGVEYSFDPDPAFAEEPAERALFATLSEAQGRIDAALAAEDFAAAMAAMAALRAPIDAFFDQVLVNAENPVVRRNRLCLLHRVRSVMGRVADFARIEGS
ncbi:MAG: glycine--tRNA ligase subunit beta [Alphaproteobacteria bacterium]|nr:MAG: glycine--tRNA ligase subunit beta [Alphaproteobacteria bacterium]